MQNQYGYIIIGSGFGGSVSALRLAEKGYKVLVIEKGKEWKGADFPKTNWNLRKWLWMPKVRFFGIQKITFFRHASILSGVGVGGGSLVYANTLPKPKTDFFEHGSWRGLADWEKELDPHYETAWRMLGAAINPKMKAADKAMERLADEIGRKKWFSPTKVSVFFGKAGEEVPDPFFDGKGPVRKGCTFCGECMTGCRHNAKNTLDKNYLYLARKLGVEVLAEHKVTDVKPLDGASGETGYEITFKPSTSWFGKTKKLRARGIVFSGGVLGTVPLLLRLKRKSLPRLSRKIGADIRTNNEALIVCTTPDKEADLYRGVAIGSILQVDEDSHLEPVRYGKGSGFWRTVMLPMVSSKNIFVRFAKLIFTPLKAPIAWLRVFFVRDFGKQTAVLLFMQHLDSTLRLKKTPMGVHTRTDGKAPTAFIPLAHDLAQKYSRIIQGKPMVMATETISGIPSTAHILGGAVMGENAEMGVIDSSNRVFGYKNMYVFDGSMISANPGVNPSLTITAITERGMSLIREKQPDKAKIG